MELKFNQDDKIFDLSLKINSAALSINFSLSSPLMSTE